MSYREPYSDEDFQWDCEHETRIHWKCPNNCGYKYEDVPHVNERCKCPDCGVECIENGMSYRG